MSPVPLRPFAGYGRTCEVKHGVSWHVRDVLHPLALGGRSLSHVACAHTRMLNFRRSRFSTHHRKAAIPSAVLCSHNRLCLVRPRVLYLRGFGPFDSYSQWSHVSYKVWKSSCPLAPSCRKTRTAGYPLPGDNGGRAIYPQRRLRKRKPQGSTHRWKCQDDCGAAS